VGVARHILPLLLIRRPFAWIAWRCLYAFAARLLTVWLYKNTGRRGFAASLFHAMLSHTYMLFPICGSLFDMGLGGIVMTCFAVMVTVMWGPETLVQFRLP
jgi:hypothetical protein